MINNNILLMTDSYKASHFLQYPPGTSKVFSYIESRGGKYNQTVFFGLQYLLKTLEKGITKKDVEEAKEFFEAHGEPFNYDGFMYIVNELNGKLPVRIRAVAEGTVVPNQMPLLTIENTDSNCPWLTSYLETMLLRGVWYPTTVATQSWHIKQIIKSYLDLSADDTEAEINFKLHDFGARGVSSSESAALGGAAHLINFMGSDTVEGVLLANKVYGSKMAGFSIPAAEHSTITAWGRDGELEAYKNMLKQYAKPGALVAVVSDSYDLYNAVENLWGGELKEQVVNSGATVVIRPDSGDPATVVLKTIKLLASKFGTTINRKGFEILNNVRVIQGDGINEKSIREILKTVVAAGYSASNINFGMGGGLLQQIDRDTQKFAMKASYAVVDGKGREVFKDPVTDPGKRSKKGELDLVYRMGKFECLQGEGTGNWGSVLKPVFENGMILKTITFDEVRANSNKV